MKRKFFSQIEKMRFLPHNKVRAIILLEIVIGIFLSVVSLVIFAEITKHVLLQQTMALDTSWSQMVYALRSPSLTQIMIFVSFLGADFMLFFGGILTILLTWKKHKHEAILFVLLLTIGLLINILLKVIFQRPRPDSDPILDLSSSYSFPSGHAMNSFIFYAILSYFVYHFTHKKLLSIIISICSLALVLLIGFSRVYLGVHYPSDVIAGFIAGFFVFVTAIVLNWMWVLRK